MYVGSGLTTSQRSLVLFFVGKPNKTSRSSRTTSKANNQFLFLVGEFTCVCGHETRQFFFVVVIIAQVVKDWVPVVGHFVVAAAQLDNKRLEPTAVCGVWRGWWAIVLLLIADGSSAELVGLLLLYGCRSGDRTLTFTGFVVGAEVGRAWRKTVIILFVRRNLK